MQSNLMSFRSDSTIALGQDQIINSPMFSKICPLTPLTQSTKCESYYMNSPTASISATQNCVDEISLENQVISQYIKEDSAQSTKDTLSSDFQLQEHQICQNNPVPNQLSSINMKTSCKARETPFTTAFTGIPCYLNDDNDDFKSYKINNEKRGRYASNNEQIRKRSQAIQQQFNKYGIQQKKNALYSDSDSDDYLSDSDSSVSNSMDQKYKLDLIPENQNQNLTSYPTNDTQYNYYPNCQLNNQQEDQLNNYQYNQQYIEEEQSAIQQNNFNLKKEQQIELLNKQAQLIKKGIQKTDNLQKKKCKYGYKNMSRDEYKEYRVNKATKRETKRQVKEQNAGCIETSTFYKLVLVEAQEIQAKPQKVYIKKQVRDYQMEMELQKDKSKQIISIQEEYKPKRNVLQKTNDQQYEIFQFSKNALKPLVRTVYKKELVFSFEIITENPFALMEIGVLNYQDNIEFYFINKFKIINKYINRKYNNNKYFETELTSEDFIFRNGTRFQFSVKYNCIILKNLDTQQSANLYCDKYIATNKKLNIFIRLFKNGDTVRLL